MSKIEVIKAKTRQSFTDEERQKIILEFRSSGPRQSINSFAKKVGIAPPTLHKWLTKDESPKEGRQFVTVMPQNRTNPESLWGNQQAQVESVLNANLKLTQENDWLRNQVEAYQKTLGKIVFESGRMNFETHTDKIN